MDAGPLSASIVPAGRAWLHGCMEHAGNLCAWAGPLAITLSEITSSGVIPDRPRQPNSEGTLELLLRALQTRPSAVHGTAENPGLQAGGFFRAAFLERLA